MYYSQEQESRPKRRDAGILQVTERDLLALSWIAEQFCLSFDQLRYLLALHSPATKITDSLSVGASRNALERWLQLGYIEPPRKILRGYPVHIWLSRKGLKDLQLPYAYYLPNPASIPHLYAVNAVRLHLQQYQLSTQWVSFRTLTRRTETRPLPDAEFYLQKNPLIALIILERLTNPFTLSDEMNTILQLSHRKNGKIPYYSRFWYFMDTSVITPFQEAISALDAKIQKQIVLYGLDAKELPTPL